MAVAGYKLRINGGAFSNHIIDVGNVLSYNLTGLAPETEYSIEGAAYDEWGNQSDWCEVVTTTTLETGTFVLDLITTDSLIAVGLRKLSSFYAGNCLRVRRASDGTELDIGFDGNDIDVAAITAFGASTSLVCTRWYLQNGSGRYLSEANPASCPVVTVVSGQVLISFTGSERLTDSESSVKTAPKMFLVCNPSTVSDNDYIVDIGVNVMKVSYSSNALNLYNGASLDKTSVATGLQQLTVLWQSGNDRAFINGVELSGTGNAGDTATGSVSTTLGNYGSVGGYGFAGSIQEFIMFEGALIAGEQAIIEADQMAYYGL